VKYFVRLMTVSACLAFAASDAQACTAAQVVAGHYHTCAVTAGGGVACWGFNSDGQLGDGTRTDRLTPTAVSGLGSGIAAIAAGANHTCALTTGGGVVCWGRNADGQLGNGGSGMGSRSLTPTPVVGLANGVAAIAAGYAYTCALTTGGAVLCWGDNWAGQLGDGTTAHRVTPTAVIGLESGVAALVTGGVHACAVTSAGGAMCWGWNATGQLGDGTTTGRLTPVAVVGMDGGVEMLAAGDTHTCAVTTAGGGVCWGKNVSGQLGDGTTADRWTPTAVSELGSGVAGISAGFSHTCAVATGGTVVCWGSNAVGQLGDGTTVPRLTPTAVGGLERRVATVVAGGYHTCAVTAGGGALCWGWNLNGQLGDGTTADRQTPTAVVGLAGRPAFSDFTGDLKSDILWRHATGGDVWLWPMDGAARTAETYVRTIADTNWEIRGQGDQTGDSQADLLWRNRLSGEIYFWPMNGATPEGEIYVGAVDPAYDIVGTGDFDGDGKSDILWRHTALGDVWIWLMDGAMPLSQVYIDRVDPGYVVKGVGDFDADGKADIVWHHATVGDVWVWPMDGTTRRSETWVATVPDTGYQIQGVADFTGDGHADIVWWHTTRGEVWIWTMNGPVRVTETWVATVPETDYRIAGTGDYNGDGKADLLWHHATRGEVWVWLMDGTTRQSETWVATVADIGHQIVKTTQAPVETYVVDGTVRDDGNLNLLSRVAVRLIADTGSSEIQTAFEGGFSFAGVSGPATLTATAAGYEGQSLTIRSPAPGAAVRLDLRLRRVAGRAVPCGDAPDTGNRVLPIFSSPFADEFPLTNYFDHDLPVGTYPAKGYELNFCDERAAGRLEPHRGYDWVMPVGTPLLAVADGQVTYAGTDPPFYCAPLGRVVADQRFVEILHPASSGEQFSSVFVHLSRIDVGVGQMVSRGETVGLSGNSGCSTEPHLHLHVWRFTHTNNGFPTVVDPYGWEGAGPDPWSLVSAGSSSVWLWRPGEAPVLRPR